MDEGARGGTTTILFTDLVNSTELLQRAGDETAQRIFQAHHKLVRDCVAGHGGHEVKWLGDGLMVAFPSAADAVRCAIAVQQTSRRASAGEPLDVRVGLHVGEPLRDESDYFGTPVVIAKRLCDGAEAGEIRSSSLVAALLAGRQSFRFRELGALALKGLAEPVNACAVLYDRDEPAVLLARTPFVGRREECARLEQRLREARAGRGGLVMLVGEPGIGKTRTAEEFAESATGQGALVVWGRCFEGEWAPPYGPFVEVIEDHARAAEPEALRRELGAGGGAVARLVPALRERLPDLPEAEPLQPDEERFRLLDAVAQLLIAASQRAPLVVVLDDLHWADKGTIAMLRHVARFAPKERLLLLGAYRDVELDRQHPLADALGALRRETNYERILLRGLATDQVGELISTLAEQEVPQGLVDAISRETEGNPFFIREVLLHLIDTGAIYRKEGIWTSDATSIEELGIPEGVRQVIGRRLSRLSEDANRMLTAASAASAAFRFETAAAVAGLEEEAALDALDQALAAQLLRPAVQAQSYEFTHALIRHTLYAELNPSRQVRLHRRMAEELERVYGAQAGERAGELAYQYHRSAALPGAERGVEHALAAAERAEAAAAHEEAASFLRMALELLPEGDARRPRLLARLGFALAWALEFDAARQAASEAGDLIAEGEGADAAADYLAEAMRTLFLAGSVAAPWALAQRGLRYIGDRRDKTWAALVSYDQFRQAAEDPEDPGIPADTSETREANRIIMQLPAQERLGLLSAYSSRAEALADGGEAALLFWAGEYQRVLPMLAGEAEAAERQGRIAAAMAAWANAARCHNALGNLASATAAQARAQALAGRLPGASFQLLQLIATQDELRLATDEGWDESLKLIDVLIRQPAAENQWAFAAIRAAGARVYAHLNRADDALGLLATLVAPLERAPVWAANYQRIACDASSTLWLLGRTDHIQVIERNVRTKVVEPDLRYPMQDGRRALAGLCALQGRYDEAAEWFAKARVVLEEQGARPLRAIVDFDEAWMYLRRNEPGHREIATPLLEAALRQFRELGMTGWARRAEELGG
jgi:class 3 adenylate cyclase